jgi:hypothetical protein
VTNQLKAMVIEQMIDVAPRAGEEVIDAYDDRTIRKQPLTEVRTEEASPPVTTIRVSRCMCSQSL